MIVHHLWGMLLSTLSAESIPAQQHGLNDSKEHTWISNYLLEDCSTWPNQVWSATYTIWFQSVIITKIIKFEDLYLDYISIFGKSCEEWRGHTYQKNKHHGHNHCRVHLYVRRQSKASPLGPANPENHLPTYKSEIITYVVTEFLLKQNSQTHYVNVVLAQYCELQRHFHNIGMTSIAKDSVVST